MPRARWLPKLTPESYFLIVGLVGGLAFAIFTPPFQVPDEPNHMQRAYQVSEGVLLGHKISNTQAGGSLPTSLEIVESRLVGLHSSLDLRDRWHLFRAHVRFPLKPNERSEASFPNTSLYSVVPYLPQAAAISIGRALDRPPLILMYWARLANALTAVLLIWLAICLMPVKKWYLAMVALLPMTLFELGSVSSDALTIALSALLIAFCAKYYFVPAYPARRALLWMGLLGVLLALCKLPYALLTLVLLLPRGKWRLNRQYFGQIAVIASSLIAMMGWYALAHQIYVRALDDPSVNPIRQVAYIGSHITEFGTTLVSTSLGEPSNEVWREFVGFFGWLNFALPWWVVIFTYIFLALLLLRHDESEQVLKPWEWWRRTYTALVLAGAFITIMVLMYLSWTPVGKTVILGLQGRYLIPLAMLMPLVVSLAGKLQIKQRTIIWAHAVILASTVFVFFGYYYFP
jgi:uncharacterized membrane protein